MLIGKKLNLLIIGVIAAVFIAIFIFVLIFIPTIHMKDEKDSLFTLDSAISELRADINKLTIASFDSQLEDIVEKNEHLLQQFQLLDSFEYLKANKEIDEALKIISRLYTLYEVNYKRLISTADEISGHLMVSFLSDKVKIDTVKNSRMLLRYEQKDELISQIENLYSIVSILDSNLISTHMVVVERFGVIDSLIDKRERQSYLIGIITVVLSGIGALIAAFFVASRITKNIRNAAEGIEKMSSGDLSDTFDIKSKDEMGDLGRNLNTLIASLKTVFESMKNSSNKGVELKEELIASANQTSAASAEIAANSQGISQQFSMLSERVQGATEANLSLKDNLQSLEGLVQEQTSMVEESTSAVTEMISSINNVNDITFKKRAATEGLVKTAEFGGNKLSATIKVINEINESLDQIKGTATIIQQIASQTNLLAMNAAIEAAHAGDAGRGFAVVADEIRKLAEASSMNSKEISGVLKEVVGRIESASTSGHETEAAFVEIDREVGGVAQSLDEISSSMEELNIGGKQILEAMTSLQDVSVQVSQGSGKMTEASGQVTEAIEVVSRITSEVSNSANEIYVGITEVSGAMMLVTDLSANLGDITDRLEKESACFKTQNSDTADPGCVENEPEKKTIPENSESGILDDAADDADISIPAGDQTAVTIAEKDERGLEIENLDEV